MPGGERSGLFTATSLAVVGVMRLPPLLGFADNEIEHRFVACPDWVIKRPEGARERTTLARRLSLSNRTPLGSIDRGRGCGCGADCSCNIKDIRLRNSTGPWLAHGSRSQRRTRRAPLVVRSSVSMLVSAAGENRRL